MSKGYLSKMFSTAKNKIKHTQLILISMYVRVMQIHT